MYIPSIYQEHNPKWIKAFIQDNNFGILIQTVEKRPWATHLPFMVSEENGQLYLTAHLSKANPQWKSLVSPTASESLVIFEGANAYISASWYDHENVPTWNYIAVHAYGTGEILEEKALFDEVSRLVDYHERHQQNPISMHRMSQKTLSELSGIVGIKLKVTELQAVRKLSQNRDDKNHTAITQQLEKSASSTEQDVADEMKKKRQKKN